MLILPERSGPLCFRFKTICSTTKAQLHLPVHNGLVVFQIQDSLFNYESPAPPPCSQWPRCVSDSRRSVELRKPSSTSLFTMASLCFRFKTVRSTMKAQLHLPVHNGLVVFQIQDGPFNYGSPAPPPCSHRFPGLSLFCLHLFVTLFLKRDGHPGK